MNQAAIHLQRQEIAKAKVLLGRVLKRNPEQEQAKAILREL